LWWRTAHDVSAHRARGDQRSAPLSPPCELATCVSDRSCTAAEAIFNYSYFNFEYAGDRGAEALSPCERCSLLQRHDVALVDRRFGVDLGLDHALAFVPGDLTQNVFHIELALSVDIAERRLQRLQCLIEM